MFENPGGGTDVNKILNLISPTPLSQNISQNNAGDLLKLV